LISQATAQKGRRQPTPSKAWRIQRCKYLRSDAGVKRFPLASGARWYEAHDRAFDYPEATLTVAAVVPLFRVILEVSRKLEERMPMLSQRLAICELPFSSSAGLIPSK
jgi:hypothetical protein